MLLCTKVNPGGNDREKGFALCVKVATPSQGISKAPPRGGAIAPCRPALTLTLIFQTANRHPQVGRSYLPGGFANPAPADQMHVTSMESCGPMSISTIPNRSHDSFDDWSLLRWAGVRGSGPVAANAVPNASGAGPHRNPNHASGSLIAFGSSDEGATDSIPIPPHASPPFTGTNPVCNRKDARLLSPASGCA